MSNKRTTPQSKSIPVEVVGGSSFGRYAKINSQKTYNMFISDDWLVNFAGYKKVADLLPGEDGKGRGIFYSSRGNFLIVVINARVLRLDQNLNAVIIGDLNTSQGEVFIDENLSSQICIVDGLNAWIYFYGSGGPIFTQQAGGPLGTTLVPNYVCYHNTFFLFGNAIQTGDGAKWFAYKFATNNTITQQEPELALQTKPDYARAVVRLPGQGNNVLVLGNIVCEIWTQVGGVQNYRRNSTINIDYGCVSVSTIAFNDTYVVWLASNEDNAPIIMVYSGDGAVPISTDGIDYVLSKITRPDKSTAMMYRQDGHLFYQLTFYDEADNLTLVYDFNTKKFLNLSDAFLNYHPARQIARFNNKQYFISLNNACVYLQSTDLTDYNENLGDIAALWDKDLIFEIQRIRICNTVLANDSSRFRVNSFVMTVDQGNDSNYIGNFSQFNLITEDGFQIVSETGIDLVDEYDIAESEYIPRIDLSFSKDGGETWSNSVSRQLHSIGHRQNMLQWENMGSCNTFTIKLRMWMRSRMIANNGLVEIF